MAILRTFKKQPGEVLDYDINFSAWLTALSDTAASKLVTVDDGITKVQESLTDGVVKVRLSGGSSGTSYKMTVALTTTGGLVKEDEIMIEVLEV